MTPALTTVESRLPGFDPADPVTQRGAARKAVQTRADTPLALFGADEAQAVADRWRSDGGYSLRSHLYDFLTQHGYRFDPEDDADREIYNGLFDWIAELDGDDR